MNGYRFYIIRITYNDGGTYPLVCELEFRARRLSQALGWAGAYMRATGYARSWRYSFPFGTTGRTLSRFGDNASTPPGRVRYIRR